MTEHTFNYFSIVGIYLRKAVVDIITQLASQGRTKNQALYITFDTAYPDVIVPKKWTGIMTIVLEHQFWNLKPHEDGFFVTLSFDSKSFTLFIPYQSIVLVKDPGYHFELALPYQKKQTQKVQSNTIIHIDTLKKEHHDNK